MSGSPQFSHMGLFVRDLDAMLRFYTQTFGFQVSDRGKLGNEDIVFLSGDSREHHQIVLISGRQGDASARVVNQISFRVGSLAALKELHRTLAQSGRPAFPADHGNAWSVYATDPEDNAIELFVDSPWYVRQPRLDPLDLSLSDEAIRERTRERCQGDPSFQPIERWRRAFAVRLAGGAAPGEGA